MLVFDSPFHASASRSPMIQSRSVARAYGHRLQVYSPRGPFGRVERVTRPKNVRAVSKSYGFAPAMGCLRVSNMASLHRKDPPRLKTQGSLATKRKSCSASAVEIPDRDGLFLFRPECY
jgi:hypothetical protein